MEILPASRKTFAKHSGRPKRYIKAPGMYCMTCVIPNKPRIKLPFKKNMGRNWKVFNCCLYSSEETACGWSQTTGILLHTQADCV